MGNRHILSILSSVNYFCGSKVPQQWQTSTAYILKIDDDARNSSL